MRVQIQSTLARRDALTAQLWDSPYNTEVYLQRAHSHEDLGFSDLAVGDAYRALLLTDEILDQSGEYHEKAIEAIGKVHHHAHDEDTKKSTGSDNDGEALNEPVKPGIHESVETNDESLYEDVARYCARRAFVILTRALLDCKCLNSAYDFSLRGLKAFPGHLKLQQQQDKIIESHRQKELQKNSAWDESKFDPKKDLPEKGSARREIYPWNSHEPDRFSSSSLQFLNSEMRKAAPKCEVRAVSLPFLSQPASTKPTNCPPSAIQQLGIFATEDISPHETVLHESSLLTANNRLYDPLCDACSSPLPPVSPSGPCLPSCPSCDDTIFCSGACYTASQKLYHPAVCGKPEFDILARDPSPPAATDALYLLLLARTIALSETQKVHPLDLPQIKYIWGDFVASDETKAHAASASAVSTARQLPFTFHDNILAPLHILEKMDIDIFASLPRCDTWVLNTLFAKFRATASARLSTRDGRPEVCAVHAMWCLANHSCAPNVSWEWGGDIRFVARGEAEVERWKDMPGEKGKGIRKGEEVLNHYCDVDLGVTQRREWAIGALGGICICQRCVWEEGRKDDPA